jgi:ligand-binding sensor domain-containing protein
MRSAPQDRVGMAILRSILLIAMVLTLASSRAQAASAYSLDQFRRTDFTSVNGAPQGVNGLAQSNDGYIWIAAADGLYRFDGITFERIKPLPGRSRSMKVISVFAARNGDVWVGYFWGGVARVRDLREDCRKGAEACRAQSQRGVHKSADC